MTTAAVIKLGSRAAATAMFAYPNAGHPDQTLGQTIEHYFNDSMQRENSGAFQVSAQESDALCSVTITGDDAETVKLIGERYQAFYDAGQIGLQAATAFRNSGKWDAQWQFFLPVGIPLAFARAVEIMDFPPLTLIGNQDYLKSKTTGRWWELLMLNGVSDGEKCLYSCILDIVPVAAPAGDGQKLDASGIYNGPFDLYDMPLLETLVRTQQANVHRPLIALGMPIRTWIQRNWSLSLQVGQVGAIKSSHGDVLNVIASNHPSLFFYVVHANTGPDGNAKNLAAGLAVMKQDIVCAAWHAAMGRNPSADPQATLQNCTAAWQGKDEQLLALVKKQGGFPLPMAGPIVTPVEVEEALKFAPTAADLAQLEKQFYAEGGAYRE